MEERSDERRGLELRIEGVRGLYQFLSFLTCSLWRSRGPTQGLGPRSLGLVGGGRLEFYDWGAKRGAKRQVDRLLVVVVGGM